MNKNLLTFDDLYSFFVLQNQSYSFSSKESDTSIVVHVIESMNFSDQYDPNVGLLKTHLKSCHLYRNRNTSSISEEAMTEAIPSFYNRPILGFIHQLSDGSYDFAGHEFTIDKDGNVEYQEVPVGVIPESCNAQLVYDEEKDKTYLELDGLIYENYSRAADILREKGEAKVSVEIAVDEMSYSASEKVLNIEKFHFLGVTILGRTTDSSERIIEEGMEGSNITLADFSAENNSLFSKENQILIEMLEKLDSKIDSLSNFTINQNTQGKEETEVGKTEIFEDEVSTEEQVEEVLTNETNDISEETPVVEEKMASVEVGKDEDDIKNDDNEVIENESLKPEKYSITYSDGTIKEFGLSLDEISCALHNLVNDMYGEADNVYYSVCVYEDGYVIMQDYWNDITYKQNFKREEDNFSLVGDRVEVFKNYLTKEEELALSEMRKNYSIMEEKLNTYVAAEQKAEKELIFNAEEYDCIKDSEEFQNLINDSLNYTVDEIRTECDALLLAHVKTNKTFSIDKTSTRKINIGAKQEETHSPYGNLFSNYKK